MSDFEDKLKRLREPFPADQIEWRIGKQGISRGEIWAMVLAYLTNRAIMDRLDEVCGPLGWKNEYKEWHGNAQLCGISIWCEDRSEWITKWDGAQDTKVEEIKGGLSDSMKRAAVQWGIGRYLYDLESTFASKISETRPSSKQGWFHGSIGKGNDKRDYYWQPPQLPEWALPKGSEKTPPKSEPKRPPRGKEAKNLDETLDALGCGYKVAKETFCAWMETGPDFEHRISGLTVEKLNEEETAKQVMSMLRAMKKNGWDKDKIQESMLEMV